MEVQMFLKQSSLLGIVLVFSGGVLAWNNIIPNALPGSAQANSPQNNQRGIDGAQAAQAANPPQQLPPDSVLFDLLFHRLRTYQQEDERLEMSGKSRFLEQKATLNYGLTGDEGERLQTVATDYLKVADTLDEKARQIIDKGRAKFPRGEIKVGQTAPPPPAELGDLQRQREEALSAAIGSVQSSLSEASFLGLQQHLRQEAAGNMKPVQFLPPAAK
jgi:hypothetical protein